MFCREVRLPTSLSFSRRIHGRLAGFYFFAWKATKDQRAAVPYEPYYTGTPRPDAHASLRGWIESYAERDMVWSRVVQGHETKRTGQLCECDYGSGPDRQAEWASGLLSSIFWGHTARSSLRLLGERILRCRHMQMAQVAVSRSAAGVRADWTCRV